MTALQVVQAFAQAEPGFSKEVRRKVERNMCSPQAKMYWRSRSQLHAGTGFA